jgi:hypothetical protein
MVGGQRVRPEVEKFLAVARCDWKGNWDGSEAVRGEGGCVGEEKGAGGRRRAFSNPRTWGNRNRILLPSPAFSVEVSFCAS